MFRTLLLNLAASLVFFFPTACGTLCTILGGSWHTYHDPGTLSGTHPGGVWTTVGSH